jgi:hypothetical protein
MFPKTLGIILGASAAGVILISTAMMSASGWETPGTYVGTSDASHMPTSTTHCYSFQTDCKNTNTKIPASDLDSGAFLGASYH